jgi:hypothetical protein
MYAGTGLTQAAHGPAPGVPSKKPRSPLSRVDRRPERLSFFRISPARVKADDNSPTIGGGLLEGERALITKIALVLHSFNVTLLNEH